MKSHNKKNYTLSKQSFSRAFTRKRAGGSLAFGIYTRDREASITVVASLPNTSLGKEKKEPRLVFTPSFEKLDTGFYQFTGLKLKGDP